MEQNELLQIQGTVEEIVFKNYKTGFCVLELSVGNETIIAVGELATAEVGEELILTGNYTNHPSFGTQFKVQMFQRRLPETANAIYKYLCSGVVKGIGEVFAKRIVDKFGVKTLEIIEQNPECLAEIKGISPKKAEVLAQQFKQLFGARAVMLFLEKYGISPTESVKVWNKWGGLAIDLIQNNPYSLCCEDIGVRFSSADEIATKLEISSDDNNRIKTGLEYILRHNAMANGHTCLPREQLISIASNLLKLDPNTINEVLEKGLELSRFYSVVINKEYIFLPNFFIAEDYVAQRLAVMLEKSWAEYENIDVIIDLEEENSKIKYEAFQRKAIKEAIANNVFILTGGPGTGKTTTLNAIISIFKQQGLKVGIAAPTGRAAKRITELTGEEALTIHRMLGVVQNTNPIQFIHNEHNPLKYDALIIDEMSMVDCSLFYSLLKALKQDGKIIMTGDFNQLPSVSAGNVLKELISSDCIPFVELKEIFRQAAQSLIITNSHDIVNGNEIDLSRSDSDFFFMGRQTMADVAETISDLCSNRLVNKYKYSPFDDIQVVCPSRKSLVGTIEINKLLQSKLNPRSKGKNEISYGLYTFREGDKVMQIKNDYNIEWKKGNETGVGIFNGDIGVITKIYKSGGIILIDFDGRKASYTTEMIKELELAYAITIHKSQGNEFKAVIIPVMSSFNEFYNRNLLYTAITRARELVILVGSSKNVNYMINQVKNSYRYTRLKYFVRKYVLGEE